MSNGQSSGDLTADAIFGAASAPNVAAVKAARQAIRGEPPDDELSDTDAALVAAFALEHADRFQFDHSAMAWMVCRNGIWRRDTSAEMTRAFQGWRETRAFDQVAAASSARDLEAVRRAVRRDLSAHAIRRNVELAQSQQLLATDGAGWNSEPFVIGTCNGQLVDLRTGAARAARPEDRLTMSTGSPFDPAVAADRWRRFVLEIADDDPERAELLRLVLGYACTGDISEQVFFVLLGAGANGKSTLLEIVAAILGDYAGLLPFNVLTRDRDARAVQAEIAQLPGVRFVRASELRENVYLDEGRIKAWTGGDPVSCAHKFGRPFTFRPVFKLVTSVNHRPRVSDRSHGFWRKAVLIPFTRTFAIDKTLSQQLADEAPGILAWLVEAAMDWRRLGLPRSAAVDEAAREWRSSEDLIGQWADAALKADSHSRLGAAAAYAAFTSWAEAEHLSERERPGRRTFGEWLAERFERHEDKTGRFYRVRVVDGGGLAPQSGIFSHTRACEKGSQKGSTPSNTPPTDEAESSTEREKGATRVQY